MKHEISAGIIVYHEKEYLLLKYEGGYWGFSRGHPKNGESYKENAMRELEEETGISNVKLKNGFEEQYEFFFKKNGVTIKKRVVFYLGEVDSKQVRLSHEHDDYCWVPYEQAIEKLKFEEPKELLEKVESTVGKKHD